MKDQVYIIGAGAIGKALVVFLQLEGHSVTLLRGSTDYGDNYREAAALGIARRVIAERLLVAGAKGSGWTPVRYWKA